MKENIHAGQSLQQHRKHLPYVTQNDFISPSNFPSDFLRNGPGYAALWPRKYDSIVL